MHNKYLFSNIFGTFIFNEHFKPIKSIMFRNTKDYLNREQSEKQLAKNFKNLKKPEDKELKKILALFKKKDYLEEFYSKNLVLTKKLIKESVRTDVLIIQAVNNISDIDKVVNILVKRLRDWYSLYNPEFERSMQNHEKFVELILKNKKKDLLNGLTLDATMGADLNESDLMPMLNLADSIRAMYELKRKQERYLESQMKQISPNLTAISGFSIGAKLLEKAGSLRRLAMFPASTVQLLGAEKALFRHMKNKKNKPPKFGIIHEHPLVSQSKRQIQGKAARALADKIAIAVKVDYFKGEFIGNKLRTELEKKFKNDRKI